MNLLHLMNVILDFIWTLPVQPRGIRNKWTLQKNLVHGRIRTTNTSRPPDYKSTVITSRPHSLDMRWNKRSMKVISIWSISGVSLITYEYLLKTIIKLSALINLQNNTDVISRYGCNSNIHLVDPVYVHKFTCLFIDRIEINFMDI